MGNKKAAEGLAEEGEAGPGRCEDIVAFGEVDELEGVQVEGYVEAFLDGGDGGVAVDVVVAGIHSANGARISALDCCYGRPEDAFTATASIAGRVSGISI